MGTVTNAELKQILTTNAQTTNANFQAVKGELAEKVDKVTGKGLSTNDYTTAEKNKLSALPTNADLQENYVAKETGKGLSTNDFTNALKTKLEGLENAPSVTIEQAATPDSGMASTYQLKVGGVATGAKINVAKDKVIGTPLIKTCTTANNPLQGLKVGDKYIEFAINNSTDKQYLSVQELYNVYTNGLGIVFDGTQIKIDTAVVAQKSDLATVATSGSYNDLTDKPNIPTNNNVLTNGAGYQTEQNVRDIIDDIISDITITPWANITVN